MTQTAVLPMMMMMTTPTTYVPCTVASLPIGMELYKMISVDLTHEFAAMESFTCKNEDSEYLNVNIPPYNDIDCLANVDASHSRGVVSYIAMSSLRQLPHACGSGYVSIDIHTQNYMQTLPRV
jgi:hypothetical protein